MARSVLLYVIKMVSSASFFEEEKKKKKCIWQPILVRSNLIEKNPADPGYVIGSLLPSVVLNPAHYLQIK